MATNNLLQFKDICEGSHVLILGGASSIKKHNIEIRNYIIKNNCVTIGTNRSNEIFVSDYHIWTNNDGFKKHGQKLLKESKKIFGCYLNKNIIKEKCSNEEYLTIFYDKKQDSPQKFSIDKENWFINGNCKTCGNLAIIISYFMGAKKIEIVGMDGYTLYSMQELLAGNSQHCYGVGKTDDYSWEDCKEKDKIIYKWLKVIRKVADFKILTPTIYNDFYQSGIL